jgi:plasmid stabilization system protein ParE
MLDWRLNDEAYGELVEAVTYYNNQSQRSGQLFVSILEDSIERILRMPYSAPVWEDYPHVRHRVLRRFPYSIIYLLEHEEVIVVALARDGRRPGYWLGRLR